MCPVGVLIPDRVYRRSIEGLPAERLPPDVLREVIPTGTSIGVGFLIQLQWVHDNWDPEHWASVLDVVAVDWGLTP